MKKYFVVDYNNPVPTFQDDGTEEVACPIAARRRIMYRLLENFPRFAGSTNIIVGVTRGNNVTECDISLKIVTELINMASERTVFNNHCVLNSETLGVEAGLDDPPDVEGSLHFLSDRPSTKAIFKDKNCWWNEHYKLKKSVGKFSKQRLRKADKRREK